ncbi:hypothetical protein [Algoriphagus sp. NG3]|uniref:hypothetical protein n=1 Tax=Algoriphagus sp. NG3 TaxID=3097546 RepID=UPI002A83075F|nr:hypothetical protein [Algoriphagus sp. NG3]WPR77717.1 hypothetical protein SLW71_10215 [Algoriphagus sp. NG3]
MRSFNTNLKTLDFSRMNFTPPLLAVHYASLIAEFPQLDNIGGMNSYLETIKFPKCLSPASEDEWETILNSYLLRTYIPIIKFGTSSTGDHPSIREKLLSHVFAAIRRITQLPTNYFTAISYMLSELTDNIVEHSKHKFGYLAFQYYRENGFMDICLADRGVGLLGSYQNYIGERDFSHITDHRTAVDSAVKGRSTKHVAEDRGFGVATSRKILTQGLGGSFVYLTGNALLINEELSNFGIDSKGIIILVRIPVGNFRTDFNWSDHVE